MRLSLPAAMIGLSLCLPGVLVTGAVQSGQSEQSAERAELPSFEDSFASELFFEDVFAKLLGRRPADLDSAAPASPTPSGGPSAEDGGEGEPLGWPQRISATAIEDEVKSLKMAVDKNVTTPSEFAGGGYRQVRRDFSLLAVLFAIISEYDGEVRWKDQAAAARDLFSRTASNARAGGNSNVYQEAKLRQEELNTLLRGSRLAAEPKQAESHWEEFADRSVLMQRLEAAYYDRLSGWTSDADAFSENREEVLHEAQMIAAIGEVLTREGMEDGEDEEYAEFAERMKEAAADVAEAVKLRDAEQARRSAGQIGQACSQCHEFYR